MWSTTVSPPSPCGPGSHAHAHDEGRRVPVRSRATPQQRFELRTFRRLDQVVGIEPEGIIASGAGERCISGGGEVVDPDEIKHPRPERPGDFNGAIRAAGIEDDDLVKQPASRNRGRAADYCSSLTIMVSETRAPLRHGPSAASVQFRVSRVAPR